MRRYRSCRQLRSPGGFIAGEASQEGEVVFTPSATPSIDVRATKAAPLRRGSSSNGSEANRHSSNDEETQSHGTQTPTKKKRSCCSTNELLEIEEVRAAMASTEYDSSHALKDAPERQTSRRSSTSLGTQVDSLERCRPPRSSGGSLVDDASQEGEMATASTDARATQSSLQHGSFACAGDCSARRRHGVVDMLKPSANSVMPPPPASVKPSESKQCTDSSPKGHVFLLSGMMADDPAHSSTDEGAPVERKSMPLPTSSPLAPTSSKRKLSIRVQV